MVSYVHIDNKKKYILIFDKSSTQRIRWYDAGCIKNVFH